MVRIQITIGERRLQAELNDGPYARALAGLLPLEFSGSPWGDEIYGTIPSLIPEPGEDVGGGTVDVEVGDLAYWLPGSAFCVFYGPTPASVDEKPVPASEVIPLGCVTGDATALRGCPGGAVRIESME